MLLHVYYYTTLLCTAKFTLVVIAKHNVTILTSILFVNVYEHTRYMINCMDYYYCSFAFRLYMRWRTMILIIPPLLTSIGELINVVYIMIVIIFSYMYNFEHCKLHSSSGIELLNPLNWAPGNLVACYVSELALIAPLSGHTRAWLVRNDGRGTQHVPAPCSLQHN